MTPCVSQRNRKALQFSTRGSNLPTTSSSRRPSPSHSRRTRRSRQSRSRESQRRSLCSRGSRQRRIL
jgi:hypothetical protein